LKCLAGVLSKRPRAIRIFVVADRHERALQRGKGRSMSSDRAIRPDSRRRVRSTVCWWHTSRMT